MKDETYLFISDIKDKKRTARGSHNRKAHAGKGGKVMFPSDFMTNKERNAMSGEVKSYSINKPMKWNEFLGMPVDIQIMYIKGIREKFHVSDCKIYSMLGVPQSTGQRYFATTGFPKAEYPKGQDIDGWNKWICGDSKPEEETSVTVEPEAEEVIPVEPVKIPAMIDPIEKIQPVQENKPMIPSSGTLRYKGNATDILCQVKDILGDSNIAITITWDVVEVRKGCEYRGA